MNSYNVIFKGEIAEGKDRHKLSLALAKFLKIPEEKAHLLFSGNPICIKKALSESEANALKAKLNAVGIITYIKPVTTQAATAVPVATAPVTPQQVAKPSIETKPSTATKPTVKSYDDLSKGWQKVFAEFDLRQADKLGYFASAKSPAHTSRPKMEQFKGNYLVGFNMLAFFFGPLYYMVKGMWKKGIYLTVFLSIFNIVFLGIFSFITDKDLTPLTGIINSVICASIAHYDYYRYYKLGETIWPWMPKWMGSTKGISMAVAVLILGIGALLLIGISSDISRVKNSPLPFFNEYEIGEALDSYSACDNIQWEEIENNRGLKFVQYTCNIYRPSAESNYVAEIKMLNDFYDNELKQPNTLKDYIEKQRKWDIIQWPISPKQYNVIAQFSIVDGVSKVLYTGVEIIYPKVLYTGAEKIYPNKTYNNEAYQDHRWFFQSIRNDVSVAQPAREIIKPRLDVEEFRQEIETVRRNRASTW
ncbi:DUF2628 domain-containing protein [Shewanella sp. SM20]|uniref:DUF2628 domain-containing protein n=1 Tax=Shewanella sp. SM20 TaxID=2912792 RepID=UPI0021D924E6|nr:DUF2628 domain-containing protein [Shewanella sp. SM20]MCU8092593.1 DUF2628 domain-containing protein [Shewanella sp. SM20]